MRSFICGQFRETGRRHERPVTSPHLHSPRLGREAEQCRGVEGIEQPISGPNRSLSCPSKGQSGEGCPRTGGKMVNGAGQLLLPEAVKSAWFFCKGRDLGTQACCVRHRLGICCSKVLKFSNIRTLARSTIGTMTIHRAGSGKRSGGARGGSGRYRGGRVAPPSWP